MCSAKQQPVDMSPEEMRLLRELRVKKQAAESIFRALERAEAAATAAATASGMLAARLHVNTGGMLADGLLEIVSVDGFNCHSCCSCCCCVSNTGQ